MPRSVLTLVFTLTACQLGAAITSGQVVQDRIDTDIGAGRPIVIHVIVALCDNRYQGIVPVPKALGNGQDPDSNLYWGAAFGVRTFLTKHGGWSLVSRGKGEDPVLERIVMRKQVKRGNGEVWVYMVADAWDGKAIQAATERFLSIAAGRGRERLDVDGLREPLEAGGAAHLIGYVGHDGLMEFSLEQSPTQRPGSHPRSSLVLACASKAYFSGHLSRGGSHALLVTTNLMAPEAYTLDAAATAFASGQPPSAVLEAAAVAYSRYQKCSLKAARALFSAAP